MSRYFVLTIYIATTAIPGLSFADGPGAPGARKSPESANYNKALELLPGERVVTPTGQQMNVWSADSIRPAIEATRAANPGQLNTGVGNGGVIIDTRGGFPGNNIVRQVGGDAPQPPVQPLGLPIPPSGLPIPPSALAVPPSEQAQPTE